MSLGAAGGKDIEWCLRPLMVAMAGLVGYVVQLDFVAAHLACVCSRPGELLFHHAAISTVPPLCCMVLSPWEGRERLVHYEQMNCRPNIVAVENDG